MAEYLPVSRYSIYLLIQCIHYIIGTNLFHCILSTLFHFSVICSLYHDLLLHKIDDRDRDTSTFWLNPPKEKRLHSSSSRGLITGPLHGCFDLFITNVTFELQSHIFCRSDFSIRPHIWFQFFQRGDFLPLPLLLLIRSNHKLHHHAKVWHSTGRFFVPSDRVTSFPPLTFPPRESEVMAGFFTVPSSIPSGYASPGFQKFMSGLKQYDEWNTEKMKKACLMLRDSESSVSEICALLGFYDDAYFCKLFKEYHGVTPAQYRKMR